MPSFLKAAPEKTKAKPQRAAVTNERYLMDSEESKFTLQFNMAFTSSILLCTRCMLYIHVKAEAVSKNCVLIFFLWGKKAFSSLMLVISLISEPRRYCDEI